MWKPGMTWSEINTICLHMGDRLRSIRSDRGINTKTNCKCGCGGDMVVSSKISIRSFLFSLKKIEVISESKLRELDKKWKSYQRKQKLNGYYEPKQQ
jgi:hypothetical protein